MNKCGIPADQIDADRFRRFVHGLREFDRALAACRADDGDRRDGNALVDDRYAVFALNILAGFDEIFGAARDFLIYLGARLIDVCTNAVQKGDAHGDGADVQIFILDHPDGFQNIVHIDHAAVITSFLC